MKIAHEIYEKQKIYKYINEFLVSREFNGDECSRYDLTIVLKDFPCWEESEKLTINFLGIKDLKLNNIENLFQVCFRFLYKGIIIKHNKTEPTYTKTSLFLCEKRRFFMGRTEKGGKVF